MLFRKSKNKINGKNFFTKKAVGYSAPSIGAKQEATYLITEEINGRRLLLISDSLGKGGNIASNIIMEVFQNFFPQNEEFANPEDFLRKTIFVAASLIMQKTMTSPGTENAAATLSGFFIDNSKFYVINVGRNRSFLFRNKKLSELIQTNYKQYEEEKFTAISKNLSNIEIESHGPLQLQKNDTLLTITKGIYSVLDEEEIEKLLKANKKTDNLAKKIVNFASKNGTTENLTAVIYKY